MKLRIAILVSIAIPASALAQVGIDGSSSGPAPGIAPPMSVTGNALYGLNSPSTASSTFSGSPTSPQGGINGTQGTAGAGSGIALPSASSLGNSTSGSAVSGGNSGPLAPLPSQQAGTMGVAPLPGAGATNPGSGAGVGGSGAKSPGFGTSAGGAPNQSFGTGGVDEPNPIGPKY